MGAALGVAFGGALTAVLVRCGSRILAGVLAALLAYGAVLAPLLVLTRPSDVAPGELVGLVVYLVVPFGALGLIGAVIGTRVASAIGRS
jgi:hypothetical protein